jgi:hypothetical protein
MLKSVRRQSLPFSLPLTFGPFLSVLPEPQLQSFPLGFGPGRELSRDSGLLLARPDGHVLVSVHTGMQKTKQLAVRHSSFIRLPYAFMKRFVIGLQLSP